MERHWQILIARTVGCLRRERNPLQVKGPVWLGGCNSEAAPQFRGKSSVLGFRRHSPDSRVASSRGNPKSKILNVQCQLSRNKVFRHKLSSPCDTFIFSVIFSDLNSSEKWVFLKKFELYPWGIKINRTQYLKFLKTTFNAVSTKSISLRLFYLQFVQTQSMWQKCLRNDVVGQVAFLSTDRAGDTGQGNIVPASKSHICFLLPQHIWG